MLIIGVGKRRLPQLGKIYHRSSIGDPVEALPGEGNSDAPLRAYQAAKTH